MGSGKPFAPGSPTVSSRPLRGSVTLLPFFHRLHGSNTGIRFILKLCIYLCLIAWCHSVSYTAEILSGWWPRTGGREGRQVAEGCRLDDGKGQPQGWERLPHSPASGTCMEWLPFPVLASRHLQRL